MNKDKLHILQRVAIEAKQVRDHLNKLCDALDSLYMDTIKCKKKSNRNKRRVPWE